MSGYDEQSDEQLPNPAKCTMKCIALNTSNDVNRSKKSSLQLSRSECSLLKTPRENLEERLEKLKIDYNKAGKICKRMEKFIVKLKEEIEAKNSTVKKLLSEKKDLQSKLNRSIRNCDTFEEKLEDMEEENRKLIAQIAHLTKEKIKEIEHLEDKLKRYEEQYELSFITRNRLGVENRGFVKMSHDEVEEDKKKMLQELNETKERLESKEQSKLLAEMRKRLRAGIPGFDRMTINEVTSHILVTPTHEQLAGLEDLNVEHFIKSLEISSEDKKQEFREYIKQVYQKGYVRANVDLIMQQSLAKIDNQERQQRDAFYFRGNSITDKFQHSDPQSKHPPNSRNLKSILRMEFPEKPSSIL
ncbi:hypothetical protein L3Y34_019350 [Caenorhabditis briggsae]|uniref:Uncharacterized protein n=1 Tax=Caenorhabditis briggsae TaxID=6238 RepID=A0AAE9IW02_CAEBR|nr:hypothetical protein L3Y34_019350 [Caenorhabditis briggsae]